MTEELEHNFLMRAMHNYDNPQCTSITEFEEDLKRFLYIKKLIYRYKTSGNLRERLILNHLIILYNVFGDAATGLLFSKIEQECWDVLATFLVYMQRMPDIIVDLNIKLADIKLDENVIETLRKI